MTVFTNLVSIRRLPSRTALSKARRDALRAFTRASILGLVPCPTCQAAIGKPCHVVEGAARPILHPARRMNWLAWKREQGGLL